MQFFSGYVAIMIKNPFFGRVRGTPFLLAGALFGSPLSEQFLFRCFLQSAHCLISVVLKGSHDQITSHLALNHQHT